MTCLHSSFFTADTSHRRALSQPVPGTSRSATRPPTDREVMQEALMERLQKRLRETDKLVEKHRERAERFKKQEKYGREKGERRVWMNEDTGFFSSGSASSSSSEDESEVVTEPIEQQQIRQQVNISQQH